MATIGVGALYALARLAGHGSDWVPVVACYNVASGVATIGTAYAVGTCVTAHRRRWVHRCVAALAAQCALPLLFVAAELSARMESTMPGLGRPRSDELLIGVVLLGYNTILAIAMELTASRS